MPLGERGEILDDARGIGAEIVGAVLVDEDPGGVDAVMGVSAEVVAAVNDHALPTGGG
jgi:hypothetical protein